MFKILTHIFQNTSDSLQCFSKTAENTRIHDIRFNLREDGFVTNKWKAITEKDFNQRTQQNIKITIDSLEKLPQVPTINNSAF